MGGQVGLQRCVQSQKKKHVHRFVNPNFDWDKNIEGALAEVAFAKYTGLYWDGSVNVYAVPDVAQWMVRHTKLDNGCLIVRHEDKDHYDYVLLTGTTPKYTIRGFLRGGDAKQDKYWREDENVHSPAWFVPQADLIPFPQMGG